MMTLSSSQLRRHSSSSCCREHADIRSGWLQLCLRVLREGGRLVTIEPGRPVGIRSLFSGAQQDGETGSGGETGAVLAAAGFRNVRLLGDSEGLRFVEAVKAN